VLLLTLLLPLGLFFVLFTMHVVERWLDGEVRIDDQLGIRREISRLETEIAQLRVMRSG